MLVLTRENLDLATAQTLFMPDADAIYDQAERAISAALAKHQVQEELDFDGGDAA